MAYQLNVAEPNNAYMHTQSTCRIVLCVCADCSDFCTPVIGVEYNSVECCLPQQQVQTRYTSWCCLWLLMLMLLLLIQVYFTDHHMPTKY